jgi:hypothetical protein
MTTRTGVAVADVAPERFGRSLGRGSPCRRLASTTRPPTSGTARRLVPRRPGPSVWASPGGRTSWRSRCARRSHPPATRRAGPVGTSGTRARSTRRCRTPRVSSRTTTSSESRFMRSSSTRPVPTFSARSRNRRGLVLREPDGAQLFHRHRTARGVGGRRRARRNARGSPRPPARRAVGSRSTASSAKCVTGPSAL